MIIVQKDKSSIEPIYEVTFDIEPLAQQIGIEKHKAAEMLADELMKILGLNK